MKRTEPMGEGHNEGGLAPTACDRFQSLANLFPLMVGEPLDALVEDIRVLQEPTVTYQGQILDGRNREIACRSAGVSPRYVQFEGDDPIAFMLYKNVSGVLNPPCVVV
jgi:hypothetical protein